MGDTGLSDPKSTPTNGHFRVWISSRYFSSKHLARKPFQPFSHKSLRPFAQLEALGDALLDFSQLEDLMTAILILKSNKRYRQKQIFKEATKYAPGSAAASQSGEYIEYLYSKYLKEERNLEQKFSRSERKPNKN